jgi:hypothetical protein
MFLNFLIDLTCFECITLRWLQREIKAIYSNVKVWFSCWELWGHDRIHRYSGTFCRISRSELHRKEVKECDTKCEQKENTEKVFCKELLITITLVRLGFELRAWHLQSRYFTTWAIFPVQVSNLESGNVSW